MIMTAGTKIDKLRHTNMTADLYVFDIVDPYVLPDPAVIPYRQPPGILDPHMWLDYDSFADTGSKPAQ